MKAKDVVHQLVGEKMSGWDEQDLMAYSFYNVEHEGVKYPHTYINFQTGIVEFYTKDNKIAKTYAIKATLEKLT